MCGYHTHVCAYVRVNIYVHVNTSSKQLEEIVFPPGKYVSECFGSPRGIYSVYDDVL